MLEPIDDIKLQVQANTITMKQIKDMVMKESAEATERDEKIIKLIEDLREEMMKKTTSEPSFNHPHPDTEMIHKHKVQFEEPPIPESETELNS